MNQAKQFSLNGECYSIEDDINLIELIQYFNYNDGLLVLEYNNSICIKKHWKNITINYQQGLLEDDQPDNLGTDRQFNKNDNIHHERSNQEVNWD